MIRSTAHCHPQCVSGNLANRASHTSFNRLFFAGSCKARPLTFVGWTFLSVSMSMSMSRYSCAVFSRSSSCFRQAPCLTDVRASQCVAAVGGEASCRLAITVTRTLRRHFHNTFSAFVQLFLCCVRHPFRVTCPGPSHTPSLIAAYLVPLRFICDPPCDSVFWTPQSSVGCERKTMHVKPCPTSVVFTWWMSWDQWCVLRG